MSSSPTPPAAVPSAGVDSSARAGAGPGSSTGGSAGGTATSQGRKLPPLGTIARNIALVLVLMGMLWLMLNVRLPSVGELRQDLEDLGPWAYVGFVGLYAAVAITPIPVTVMALVGGMAFGLALGTTLSMIGVVIGCLLAYWLALALGRDTVMRLLGSHAETVEDKLAGGGFVAVCTLRLMPGLPYWPVNYGAGALGVNQREYLVATALSCLPGQLSLVAVGAYLGAPGWGTGIAVISCWVLVVGLTVFSLKKWREVRQDESGDEAAASA